MGWRVGLLIPSSNSVMEVDFYRRFPHDTTLHTSRMFVGDGSPAEQERMLKHYALPAAEAIGSVLPHIVVFGSTSAAALHGNDFDREMCERIAKTTGVTTVSLAASVSQALRDSHASTIAVVTPYVDDVNRRLKARIEADGIAVSAIYGMGLPDEDSEIGAVTPETIYSFVQAHVGPRVPGEALFLSCPNYQALGALSLLKITYDVPILTSNMAVLRAVKRELDQLREGALKGGPYPSSTTING
jgi:maleate isomerase